MEYGVYEAAAESAVAKKYQLEAKIRETKQGNRSIQELYDLMNGFWDQLAALEPDELTKLRSYNKLRDEDRLVQFLMALRDDFEPYKESLFNKSSVPSLEEVVSGLKVEEKRMKGSVIYSKGKFTAEKYDDLSSIISSLSIKKQASQEPTSDGGLFSNMTKFALAGVAVAGASLAVHNYFGNSDDSDHSAKFHNVQPESLNPRTRRVIKVLTYNVWFREDVELHERMKSIGDLIEQHSPDVICFQEVTPKIYSIFKQSSWWKAYSCSLSDYQAKSRKYFCMQLCSLPVKSFSRIPFTNSSMGRELCIADTVGYDLMVATSHLESPNPPNEMFSEERVNQAMLALNKLRTNANVLFCGDMNWDEVHDGRFPLQQEWSDAWEKLRPWEVGWTFDTRSNAMLSANRPLQKRLDRFICKLEDFELEKIDMIGKNAIPGVSYAKEIRVANRYKTLNLPVLPSDHYGLLLEIKRK